MMQKIWGNNKVQMQKMENRTFVLFYCSKLYTFEKFFVIMFKVIA